jgi:hypothetical protein
MLALLVAATLAQSSVPAPGVALFLRPGPGGLSPLLRESVLASVATVLDESGFPVSIDAHEAEQRLRQANAEPCSRGIECLYRVARLIGVDVLVAVEATDFEGDVAVALEAVAPDEERRLARQSTVVRSADVGRVLRMQLEPFARELRASLAPKETDAPLAVVVKEPKVSPEPARVDLVERAQPAPGWLRAPFLASAGGAAVAGGVAVVFGVTGLGWKAKFDDCQLNPSTCTIKETTDYANAVNRNATAALVSAGISAALTSAAVLLWPKEKAQEKR